MEELMKIRKSAPSVSFGERIRQGPMLLDGAMGTLLHERGIPMDECLELANLEHPEWVLGIYQSFL